VPRPRKLVLQEKSGFQPVIRINIVCTFLMRFFSIKNTTKKSVQQNFLQKKNRKRQKLMFLFFRALFSRKQQKKRDEIGRFSDLLFLLKRLPVK
jgi:hypothetical protein